MNVQVRDPIHGFIQIDDKVANIVATPVMQRLRGIRQLALASLVYPGALHTRFDHSMGVFHVAELMAEALNRDRHEIDIIRYAALLHDIGHGPFSHVSENALERYSTLPPGQKKEKIHELITSKIIRENDEIGKILGKEDRDHIVSLLGSKGWGEIINRNIVSGPLDADKQDYLLRDSYFCGVPYGVFDIHQLHRSFVPNGDEGDLQLMIKQEGKHAVEQFIMAKYYLTTNVYRHKVRIITDQMITRAIVLGIDHDRINELRHLYTYDASDAFVKNYLEWDDARFLQTFCPLQNSNGGKCEELLHRLRERRLLKRVFRVKLRDFIGEVREKASDISKKENDKDRGEIEQQVAERLRTLDFGEVDSDFVISHAYSIMSARAQARNDEAGILVATKPTPSKFDDESALFRSISEEFKEEYFEIYAPVDTDARSRKQITIKLHEELKQIVENVLSNGGEQT